MKNLKSFLIGSAVMFLLASCKEKISDKVVMKISDELTMHQKVYQGIKQVEEESALKRAMTQLEFNEKLKEIENRKLSNDADLKSRISKLNSKSSALTVASKIQVENIGKIVDSCRVFVAKINKTIFSQSEVENEWQHLNDLFENETNNFYSSDKELSICEFEYLKIIAAAKEKYLVKNTGKKKK